MPQLKNTFLLLSRRYKSDCICRITVEHPMIEAHYITLIVLETKNGTQFKQLTPTDKPEAVFYIGEGDEVVAAYDYCNLHGLWKA